MMKLIAGFASVAMLVALMLNLCPGAIEEFGGLMFDEMDAMADSAWENGEYAAETLANLDAASADTIAGLAAMSNEVLTIVEKESAEQEGDASDDELSAALDEACEWVLSFIVPDGSN